MTSYQAGTVYIQNVEKRRRHNTTYYYNNYDFVERYSEGGTQWTTICLHYIIILLLYNYLYYISYNINYVIRMLFVCVIVVIMNHIGISIGSMNSIVIITHITIYNCDQ